MDIKGQFKTFWDKPEGTIGMVIGVIILGIAGLMGWAYILPFVKWFFKETITTILLAVLAILLGAIVLDKRNWAEGWFLYKAASMWITDKIWKPVFPITKLKVYYNYFEQRMQQIEGHLTSLAEQLRLLKSTMEDNARKIKENLKVVKVVKDDPGKKGLMIVKARSAGRLHDSNLSYQDLYAKMELLLRALQKVYEACVVNKEDIADTITELDKRSAMTNAAHKAMKGAQSLLQGDEKKKLFDEQVDWIITDMEKKLGEVDHFMDMTKNLLDGVDVQNGVYEETAMQMLAEWEKKSDSLLIGHDEKLQLTMKALDPDSVIDLDATVPEKEEVLAKRPPKPGYKELFGSDK